MLSLFIDSSFGSQSISRPGKYAPTMASMISELQ